MPFKIIRNDITKIQVDAIVNTANAAPIYSSGTDTAVYKAAGEEQLLAERRKIGYLEEGEVAITSGFKLPAKYIIHAVSPRYIDGQSGEEKKLRNCYRRSLRMAVEHDCKSIAFPLIATGGFGYPKEEGMLVAIEEINRFLLHHEILVYLVVFDTKATQLGVKLYPDLEAYIDYHYVCNKREEMLMRPAIHESAVKMSAPCRAPIKTEKKKSIKELSIDEYYDFVEENENAIDERLKHLSDTFQQYLMYLISAKGFTNTEVYQNAYLTKQLFSKIKLNPKYQPDKETVMKLCVGARLNLDETKDLLLRAGFALSPCDKRDVVFSYFIEKGYHDLVQIDVELDARGLKCFLKS